MEFPKRDFLRPPKKFCFPWRPSDLSTFNPYQNEFLVHQAKSEESGWFRTGPTDTELKYCGTARKPGD